MTTQTPSTPVAKKVASPKSAAAKKPLNQPKKVAIAAPVPVKPAPAKTAKVVVKAAKTAPAPKAIKAEKVKKPKMVRDSFTMPKPEFAVLDVLKLRAGKLGAPVKKTELIRAGIKALAAMPDANFLTAIKAVPSLKTGRPAKS